MKPYIELKIASIHDEAQGTRSFVLEGRGGKAVDYKAGQFLTLVFPGKLGEQRRSYSISSTPARGERLRITVKRVDNGEFSRYLFESCSVGSSLYTIGPAGFFVLPEEPQRHQRYFFYAAGSGIAPILPLIKTVLSRFSSIMVTLSYSNRNEAEAIFREELLDLKEHYGSRLSIVWFFSNAQQLLKARLNKLFIEQQVGELTEAEKGTSLFYLCGPHEYMQMISITLLREGVRPEQLRKEIFDTMKPPLKEQPPDQTPRQVVLRYQGQVYELEVAYPLTILEAAKARGIHLPYSCEAGKCGTCAATCRVGSVWMSYNEVLLDKEIREGRVLTCTGYPVFGDVELHFP